VPENLDKEARSGSENTEGKAVRKHGLAGAILERGFLSRRIELPKDRSHWLVTLLFILLAYALSVHVRYTWINFAQASYVTQSGEEKFFRPQMVRNGVALPNTHDSFYFGSILQKALYDKHRENHLIPSVFTNGMITYLPYLLLKTFPDNWTIEELLLKLPVWVAGLVCIPIVLIGRLYGSSLWGFFAACLAVVAHSYYNRTLAGYYDTDMFSITVPAFALCFLLTASRRESVGYLAVGALALYLGRFFYGSTQAITCALCLSFIGYRLILFLLEWLFLSEGDGLSPVKRALSHPSTRFTCLSMLFIGWALYAESWSSGKVIEDNLGRFWLGLFILVLLYGMAKFRLSKRDDDPSPRKSGNDHKESDSDPEEVNKRGPLRTTFPLLPTSVLAGLAAVVLSLVGLGVFPLTDLGPFSGTWAKLTGKLQSYSSARAAGATISGSTGYTLNFLDVKSTIREAGSLDQNSQRINNIRMRKRILEDLPLWRGEWSDSEEAPELATVPKGKKYRWFNPFEKGYPKYAGDLSLKTALLAFVGYLLLCLRYWEFCLGAPFWGIAFNCFSHFVDRPLGLRFTVHVGNVASIGLVFLLLVLAWALFRWISSRLSKSEDVGRGWRFGSWGSVAILMILFAWPNIEHAKGYYSHVVYPVNTIKVLEELNEASDPDDFVVTWWDYGSGCWFYGDTRTFTSPAHQTFDNYLTSEILRSTSPYRAANLSRLKAETFVRLQKERDEGKTVYDTAVQEIFKDGSSDLAFYQGLLSDMDDANASLPPKSRDVFLFMPYEILRIFPTILSFSSRNLYFPSTNSIKGKDPPMAILRNGKRQGSSVVFDGGYRLDPRGTLKKDGDKGGVITYGDFMEVVGDGKPTLRVKGINVDGLNIPSRPNRGGLRTLIFIRESSDLVILSPSTLKSTFAKRFFLESFDAKSFAHPLFSSAAQPRSAPFMVKADGVQVMNAGKKIVLRMRGGYAIEADLASRLAKLPGSKDPVPFSFHRRLHDPLSGNLNKLPSIVTPQARFHLIQSNLPSFRGQPMHHVNAQALSVDRIAAMYGLSAQSLGSFLGVEENHQFEEGQKIKIPSKGYDLFQSWFFMDDEAFESLLIQGFLMEDLDPSLFEKVVASPWGKVYKVMK
tara:strand:+ start:16873 stop:20247 length:3375 start_codon:yes stop_codon:yes gene_type:complete